MTFFCSDIKILLNLNIRYKDLGGEDMFELDFEMIAKLRERRARKNITLNQAANEIGISEKTLGMIENEKRLVVKRTVYEKLVNWLVNERMGVK